MNSYEARRLENIKRNQALVQQLGIETAPKTSTKVDQPPSKRRKLSPRAAPLPTRTSTRIAAATTKPTYNEDAPPSPTSSGQKTRSQRKATPQIALTTSSDAEAAASADESSSNHAADDIDALRARWTSWTPTGPPPTRDENGTFHFENYPDFLPNKSPEEMLREGSFGGSYFRPLHSAALGLTIQDDWRELPSSWTAELDVATYLTSETYRPDVNKYRVSAGQPIEAWEAAGWINPAHDIRGWFQWYVRFFQGRRCEDDERQVGRWARCVGESGRWRRTLLKKYVALGIRSVADEGEESGESKEVSPVVHQTCHHWAWEVRQDVLDRWWEEGR
ncbi:hypothetical protein W97_08680 [Coniosporium apollinis CBS 100218]|uniref:Vegetatible incompatibility protein HET-E-1 n=1 Tax=Coniosporium apollinis (strain CBS 100218) TaxID=1168221 RepID=R7Z5F1_CONA1|nr:uncharacterized protein W97_08680 [Coniosporium apollinis CBS 100218]EON69420.1 hypothetical protein W97_08680 [Coniosporium apollinis CBS 100218]